MNKGNDLLPEETGSVSDSKKALYNRLKTTMQREAQEASTGSTRRGFLHAVLTGGVMLGVVGSTRSVNAQGCCELNNLFCSPCIFCNTDCQNGCEDCQNPFCMVFYQEGAGCEGDCDVYCLSPSTIIDPNPCGQPPCTIPLPPPPPVCTSGCIDGLMPCYQ